MLIFVLLGNLWIWRILSFSLLPGLIVAAASIFLYLSLGRRNRGYSVLYLILLTFLLVFQWKTTSLESLTLLSNDEQRVQAMRLKEYPAKWLSVGRWFEESSESIAFFRILNNFFEVVDPNLYFFANHPRERVGFSEFEKFPYILFPVFLLGLFLVVKKHSWNKILLASFVVPILITSIFGHKNPLGPISFFPFMTVATAFGFRPALKWTRSLSVLYKRALTFGFVVLFTLVFLQTISYAIY